MKKFASFALVLLLSLITSCHSILGPSRARSGLPEKIPDLTKGEGPTLENAKPKWFLHCGKTTGWAYRDHTKKCDKARQILITKVPNDCPTRHDLKEGDVILGVNGKYFSKMPILEFREASKPVKKRGGTLEVILWRKGWEKERIVEVDLSYKPLDFTKGDLPGLASDWNLGATGARGWMEGHNHESYDSRQIIITKVDKVSPADAILKKGDVILGLNGKKFESDARRALGRGITKAETKAGKGQLKLLRWREGKTEDVTIKIPVMGSYSKTTPWNCEKTQKILENACRYIVKKDIVNKGNKDNPTEKTFAALALLSTGKREHLEMARKYIYGLFKNVEEADKEGKRLPSWGHPSWGWGYYNLLFTEYYLLTKDPNVLPYIKRYSNSIAQAQSGVGSWGHGVARPNHGRLLGYGAMNQPGTICWMSLILAKRCGVTNPEIEKAIERGKVYLDHFIDRQNVPYGDHIIIKSPRLHDDNGKTSAAAVAYSMLNDKKGTEFNSKMTIASWAVREYGHTGNIWSMLWGPLGAQRAGNEALSAFLLQNSWYFDLERRWDGGFTYDGKMGYSSNFDYETGITKGAAENDYFGWDTTGIRILMYTLPLKMLAIQGKETLVVPRNSDEVKQLIEDGRPAPGSIAFKRGNIHYIKDKFHDNSPEELFEILGSWSPVVRQQVAVSLAARDGDYTEKLAEMLKSKNRFERYGACMALRELGTKGKVSNKAAQQMIPLLDTDDEVQFAYAGFAVSSSKDKKAVNALLKKALQDYPNDPNDYHLRIIGSALFGLDGALEKSIEDVDRKVLISALLRLIQCKGGRTREAVANAVIPKLTFEEISAIYPVLSKSLNNYALTEIGIGTAGQMTIAETFNKFKIKEAMPLLFQHLKDQKNHGSQFRNFQLLEFVKSYGVYAKELLPEMEKYLEFIKGYEKMPKSMNPNFYKAQIPAVEQAIKEIRKSTEKPDLKSIK